MILDLIPFGSFKEIEPNILEMTINDGVDLDRSKLSVVATGLCEKYRGPYAILANRHNCYFHTDGSLEIYNNLSNMKGIAHLVHEDSSQKDSGACEVGDDPPRIFHNRADAILWLKEALAQA